EPDEFRLEALVEPLQRCDMDRRRPVVLARAIEQKRGNLPRVPSRDEENRHGIRHDRFSQVAVVTLKAMKLVLRRIAGVLGREWTLLGDERPRLSRAPVLGPFAVQLGQGCGADAFEITRLAKVVALLKGWVALLPGPALKRTGTSEVENLLRGAAAPHKAQR